MWYHFFPPTFVFPLNSANMRFYVLPNLWNTSPFQSMHFSSSYLSLINNLELCLKLFHLLLTDVHKNYLILGNEQMMIVRLLISCPNKPLSQPSVSLMEFNCVRLTSQLFGIMLFHNPGYVNFAGKCKV